MLSGNSAAYKSTYTLKPLLSQNMVHFIPITKPGSNLEVWYYFTSSTELKSRSPLINDKGVFRTVPATPGLLITLRPYILLGSRTLI